MKELEWLVIFFINKIQRIAKNLSELKVEVKSFEPNFLGGREFHTPISKVATKKTPICMRFDMTYNRYLLNIPKCCIVYCPN